jgi:hypothetical protein
VTAAIERPHLSVVRLLKNCAAGFAVRVAALSAAEKRDYAEHFASRQQVGSTFLLRLPVLCTFAFPANPAAVRLRGGEY